MKLPRHHEHKCETQFIQNLYDLMISGIKYREDKNSLSKQIYDLGKRDTHNDDLILMLKSENGQLRSLAMKIISRRIKNNCFTIDLQKLLETTTEIPQRKSIIYLIIINQIEIQGESSTDLINIIKPFIEDGHEAIRNSVIKSIRQITNPSKELVDLIILHFKNESSNINKSLLIEWLSYRSEQSKTLIPFFENLRIEENKKEEPYRNLLEKIVLGKLMLENPNPILTESDSPIKFPIILEYSTGTKEVVIDEIKTVLNISEDEIKDLTPSKLTVRNNQLSYYQITSNISLDAISKLRTIIRVLVNKRYHKEIPKCFNEEFLPLTLGHNDGTLHENVNSNSLYGLNYNYLFLPHAKECVKLVRLDDYYLELRSRNINNRFKYRKEDIPASIKPHMAAVLTRLLNLQKNNVVLDPCCGAGTLLSEAKIFDDSITIIGGDIVEEAVEIATLNLDMDVNTWDATNLPLDDNSVDRVISNLPFNRRVKISNFEELYPSILKEINRVLKSNSIAVLYTDKKSNLEGAVKKFSNIEIVKQLNIGVGGLIPTAYVLSFK